MKAITPSKARNGAHPRIAAAVKSTLAEQVKADQRSRAEACKLELQQVLTKHNCIMRVLPVITINGQPLGIDVFANPPG